jgi:hypothetical protein
MSFPMLLFTFGIADDMSLMTAIAILGVFVRCPKLKQFCKREKFYGFFGE